jgi:hypothetical protein
MKYQGRIGFAVYKETDPINHPSVYEEIIQDRSVVGDVQRRSRRFQNGSYLHDNLSVTNVISILADPALIEKCYQIRYATFMGAKWKVEDITPEPPRLILTLGGLYNAEQEEP